MMTKTTHSVFVPDSVTNWCSGESGTTVGMGATPVGEAVGRAMAEVFLRTSSNASTIMMAIVVRLLLEDLHSGKRLGNEQPQGMLHVATNLHTLDHRAGKSYNLNLSIVSNPQRGKTI